MKKKNVVILTMALLLSAGVSSYAMTGEVVVSATRIREEASINSEIVDTIYQTDKVEIIGDNGEWYQVKSGNNTGYIKKEFLKIAEEKSNTEETSTGTKNESTPSEAQNSTESNNVEEVSEAVTEEVRVPVENITLTLNVELRNSPTFISRKFTTLEAGKTVQKIGEVGNWVQVADGGIVGWTTKQRLASPLPEVKTEEPVVTPEPKEAETEDSAKKEETKKEEKEEKEEETSNGTLPKSGVVTVGTALVRKGASKDAESINTLSKNDTVNIQGEEGDWYKITSGSISGYVNKSLIDVSGVSSRSLTASRVPEENAPEESTDDTQIPQEMNTAVNDVVQREVIPVVSVSGRGNEVVAFAQQYLGYSYVSAGKRPETGFDCSGFTQYVFSNFGVSLGGSAASQASAGTGVERKDLQPGDLILFYDDGYTKIGHVGIYIGNGNFIHSANPKRGVVIDNLNTSSYYNPRFVGARRLV